MHGTSKCNSAKAKAAVAGALVLCTEYRVRTTEYIDAHASQWSLEACDFTACFLRPACMHDSCQINIISTSFQSRQFLGSAIAGMVDQKI